MGVVDPLKGASSASVRCSDNSIFNPNYCYSSCPNIISYISLAESVKTYSAIAGSVDVKNIVTN